MACPICTGSNLPKDFGVLEKIGTIFRLQGRVSQLSASGFCKPCADWFTASLGDDEGGRVKYSKIPQSK